jgi:hypothetical protein
MLIDKLKRAWPNAKFPEAPKHTLRNTITFYIEEDAEDFLAGMDGKTHKAILASKPPYDNLFIQFKKHGLWAVFSEDKLYVAFFFTEIEKRQRFKFCIQDNSPGIYFSVEISEENVLHGFKFHESERFSGFFNDNCTQLIDLPIAIIMEFLNILSCKNIKTKKIGSNKKKSRAKKPLFSYYVLQITSGKESVDSSGSKNLWSNRVHLCRGHIKTYTAEKPLFGKIIGNIWVPPHARGNKKEGVIHKDYDIGGHA